MGENTQPDHYPLSPSGAARWLTCPGSLYLEGGAEETSSIYADEGTLAHEAAYKWLVDGTEPEDPEVKESTGHFVHYCRGVREQCYEYTTEEKIASQAIEGFGGTADFAAVSKDGKDGWIVDYKHGVGVEVVAEGNAQLACYALLLSEKWPGVENWNLVVVQPRTSGPPIDEACITSKELSVLADKIMERTHVRNKDVFAAGSHCRWCRHVHCCDHLYTLAVEASAEEFGHCVDEKQSSIIDRCKKLLEIAPAVQSAIKEAEKNLVQSIQKGHVVSGYKAVESLGNREFVLPEEETIKKLQSRGCGKRMTTVQKLMSPTQLEKAGFKDKLTGLVHRKVRGIVLAKETDRRKAITFSPPGEEFPDIQEE